MMDNILNEGYIAEQIKALSLEPLLRAVRSAVNTPKEFDRIVELVARVNYGY
jgi:hypothetical protein